MRVYTEAEKCKRSSSSMYLRPPPPLPKSTKRPESFKHLAGTQKEDSGLGFFSMLMTIEARRDWVTCASTNPFTLHRASGWFYAFWRSAALPSLYEYIEHPRDRRATMLHPY